MFKNLGEINLVKSEKTLKINLNEIENQINNFDNFIIYKNDKTIKIYDRKCDHMGGKLITKGQEYLCPIHMWKFDPATGFYDNGIKKKNLDFTINNNILSFKNTSFKPNIYKSKKNLLTEIRFFNHAFLKVFGENFSFSIDPWAIGPAFNTGWWLQKSTKKDWINHLNNSNFIYISHNHPDHLHPQTLSKVNKEIPIVAPSFISNSTGKYIEELGFKNIHILNFNVQYNLKGTDLFISILKSGDFREDSGVYFSNGKFTGLLSVDSNMINFERLPEVDFYGSSFAGGASGYPLMFDNYDAEEKQKILLKDRSFYKKKRFDYLKKITPKYFMPYAGFFVEKLERDKSIKKYNKKHSVEDYLKICKTQNIKLLNVLEKDLFKFQGSKLISQSNIEQPLTDDLLPEKYLEYYKKEYSKIDEDYIYNYFTNSGYKDNLLLYIFLTDDDFRLLDTNYFIDFSKEKILFRKTGKFEKKILTENPDIKKLVLKVRKESFLNTVYNKLPWEDLLIGFQCKVLRNPNLYNVRFWNYFTNIYITSKNVRTITDCSLCETLNHFFDSQIYQKI